MLLLWNSQQKTMNNSNIPGDNRGMQPLPPRSIIDRFPKPVQLNLIGTWYQKIRGGGILYVACTGTLASLFWIGYIHYNCKIYYSCLKHSGIFLYISSHNSMEACPFFLFQALSPQPSALSHPPCLLCPNMGQGPFVRTEHCPLGGDARRLA